MGWRLVLNLLAQARTSPGAVLHTRQSGSVHNFPTVHHPTAPLDLEELDPDQQSRLLLLVDG